MATEAIGRPTLTVVPKPDAERMAALVYLREKARQGATKISALPKQTYNWAMEKLGTTGASPVRWIKRVIAGAQSWARRLMGLVGKGGAALGALWLVTSEKGQFALEYVWDKAVSAVKWTVDAAVATVATPISWLGKPGRYVAEKILAAKDWIYGKLSSLWNAGAKVREQLRHDKPAVKVANGIARFAAVSYGIFRFMVPGPLRTAACFVLGPIALRKEARDKIKELGGNLKDRVKSGVEDIIDELPEHGPRVLSRDEATNMAVTGTMAWLANDESFSDEEEMKVSLRGKVQPLLQQIVSPRKAELAATRYADAVIPFSSTGSLDEQRTLLTQLLSDSLDSVTVGSPTAPVEPVEPVSPLDLAKAAHPAGSAKSRNGRRNR